MAVIGVRYAYHNGNSVGKVASVSVAYTYEQFSRLQQYRYNITGATVTINSLGGFSSSVFNTSGTFRWCTVEMNDGTISYKVNEIKNVVLVEPNISATTKQEEIDFTTYDISGQSWNCGAVNSTTASDADDALDKCVNGWV